MHEFYYENTALPAGPLYFMIETGNLPLHIIIRLEGTGLIPVVTYRTPTVSANGTEWLPDSYNDFKECPLLTKAYTAPTVTAPGTVIITKTLFGFAQGNSMLSSQFATGIERIWRPNTKYLLKITTADSTPRFRMTIDCYEENI